jgi:hypothetical protein
LGHRAREAVEDVAPTARVVAVEALAHDPAHDLVRHELATVHDLLGLEAELGALLDRGAEHVTGRDVRDDVVA